MKEEQLGEASWGLTRIQIECGVWAEDQKQIQKIEKFLIWNLKPQIVVVGEWKKVDP